MDLGKRAGEKLVTCDTQLEGSNQYEGGVWYIMKASQSIEVGCNSVT